jgi:hypothetical protein
MVVAEASVAGATVLTRVAATTTAVATATAMAMVTVTVGTTTATAKVAAATATAAKKSNNQLKAVVEKAATMVAAEASLAAATVLTLVATRGGSGYGNLGWLQHAAACGNVWHGVKRQRQRAVLPSWLLSLADGGGGGEVRRQQNHMELGVRGEGQPLCSYFEIN